jgi:predicted esterase YcpF (UPF0227 family)
MTDDSRDRLIRLETEVEHLTKAVETMDEKLTEVHNLLLQAKGVRWAILGMAGLGGFLASKLGSLAPWLVGAPR